MGDMGDTFRLMREADAKRRQKNLDDALAKSRHLWVRHTEWHWSILLLGNRVDYWPSRNKWRWRGKTRFGDCERWLEKVLKRDQQEVR